MFNNLELITTIVTNVVGFVGIICLTYWIIIKSQDNIGWFLSIIVFDKKIINLGLNLILILIALQGVRVALRFVYEPQLLNITTNLSLFVGGLSGIIEWVILVSLLLRVGYSIKAIK